MSIFNRLPALALILIALGAIAFVNKDRLFPPSPEAEAKKAAEAKPQGRRGGQGRGPVAITAATAKTADVPVFRDGVGTVQAYNTVTVRAQVSGKLQSVNYREGQDVKKGDILAQIDPVTYKAVYDQAVAKKAQDEATLENAKRDLQRYEGLAKSDYTSRQQADTQNSTVTQTAALVRQDQANIDNTGANLNYTTIRAPIEGRTGIRQVDEGNLVSSQDATGIVVITQLKPISVVFTLPQTMVGEINDAQAAGALPLKVSVANKTIAEGKLEVVDNQIDQSTGTVKLKGTFPNEDMHLWPGQFVTVHLLLKTLPGVTVVPAAAVQQGANGTYVYLVDPEAGAKLTPVRVTLEDEKQAVIAEGLKPGDMVATSGFASLEDGKKVTMETAPAPGDAQGQPPRERGQGKKKRGENGGQKPEAKAGDPASEPANASGEAKTARDGNGQGKKSSDKPERAQ
jgi:membrane fusion protein, multidrug efflux system